MIELDHVTKRFSDHLAVDSLTLEVEAGEFCVLIGPSGCGKSTTLRMINRLIPVSGGTIRINGQNIINYRPEELRRRIGYVIQSIGLFPHMTVAQNIGVVPQLLKWPESRITRRTEQLLDMLNLDPSSYREKYPGQLSGGEAQRIGVARALAADPEILLMDEPFGAIDPITRELLQVEFSRIQKELRKTIVFVTHDIDEAIRLATRIAVLQEGKLVQHDTPESIMTSPHGAFVTEFIGTDRAIKRLSRLVVDKYVKKAPWVGTSHPLFPADGETPGHPHVWVVGPGGTLAGWMDRNSPKPDAATAGEAMNPLDPDTSGVTRDSSLKEALSRMVQLGISRAPVMAPDGTLQGEVRIEDVLSA